MQVERLRLTGFKSFVDQTELPIAPGLTGIVGPNGCGKSNLVEALRWVMGEASARRLRGGEMDDVIFGGSAGRPARNVAEVALTLDNSDRAAPFAFNDAPTIEVVRRIVRGSGSLFRINGREARARDVQLLFADAASGPHSGALVGQGRIGALIAARPNERRSLLDEAAGTSGLYARRREAELKLEGAEENLARLDDVMATLAAQIETLKKQSRQAQRYRRLGEQIREAEAALLLVRWQTAMAEAAAIAGELRAAERGLAEAAAAAAAAERAREAAEAALPPLRLAQASAAAGDQRLAYARAALDQELGRIEAARAEAEARLGQLAADIEREHEHLADADTALARLTAEQDELQRAAAGAEQLRQAAAAEAQIAAAELAATEASLQQLTEASAAATARRAALERQQRELRDRQKRAEIRLSDSERQRQTLLQNEVSPEAVDAAAQQSSAAEAEMAAAEAAAGAAAAEKAAADRSEAAAVEAARAAETRLASLTAEAEALRRVTAPSVEAIPGRRSALAEMRVAAGFEAAAAALFDGELAAPLLHGDEQATGWVELAPLEGEPWPIGVQPLAEIIQAPDALCRRLSLAGWVDNAEDGFRLQKQLRPGQALVDRDGRLWRWDGFVRVTGRTNPTAERLRQRNRLEALAGEIEIAAAAAQAARERARLAGVERTSAAAAERSAADALRAAEKRLTAARDREAELRRRRLASETHVAAVAEVIEKLAAELQELRELAAETEAAAGQLPHPGLAPSALDAARARLAAARRRDGETRAALDRLDRETADRTRRLSVIASEMAGWHQRRERAGAQCAKLAERRSGALAQHAELVARPAAIAVEAERLAQSAAAVAAERLAAEDALAAAETALRQAGETARRADAAVAEARELRARLQEQQTAAEEALRRLRGEFDDRLHEKPEEVLQRTAFDADAVQGEAAALATKLERLVREREGIGPVNLLAEQEMAETEARLAGLDRERTDLTSAIARLRRGIATLDQEGRRRLVAAFAELNRHFGDLFVRLFGGGKAELVWCGDDDPLQAGLDILASPPGKRLAALTLLSGGEQALTAIALIFAMFLTNPAPVCVLDEVDAPLDDANVDAFCRLVAETADTTGTRFLLITHHRVTMARVDRLFGVTMAERGVSQLVSVDLARAAELRQSA